MCIRDSYWGRGKVWSLRLPVTQEVAGSNPVVPAQGQIAQSVEHLSEKQGVGSSILPLATGFFILKNKTSCDVSSKFI